MPTRASVKAHARWLLLPAVKAHDTQLYKSWETGPQALLHGDSHLGNTYRTADGRAGLLDWQVVWRGRGIREVSYFLGSGVPIELRRAHEKDLLQLYLDSLLEHGAPAVPSLAEAWQDYRFFLFDAWDSASICVMWPGLQAPENVARGCERVNAAVEDLEVDKAVAAALR
jgi:aminoglycoside phosphotransferase (APT) family kinase protein